jgi:uncharacterized membrane protein YfcA
MIPEGLIAPELALALGIAALAGATRGFAGIGSGFIMMPLFSLLFGPLEAVIIVCLLDAFGSVQLFPWALPRTDWRKVSYLALGSALLIPVGTLLLINLDRELMRRTIGIVVIGFTAFLMTGWRYRGPDGVPVALGIGGLAGLLSGGTGMGGPPVIAYLLATSATAEKVRANIVSYFLLLVTFIVVAFAWNGAVTELSLWRTGALLPVFLAALWVGAKLYPLAAERTFRRIAYALMMLSGFTAVVR